MSRENSKYSNIVKKALISTSCLVTLTTFTNVISFGDLSWNQSYQVSAASTKPITAYTDYNSTAYWASPMKWAVEKGIIKGYPDMKHPTTGKYGSWLDPNGKLTEAQYLTMLFRMTEEDTVNSISPQINHWASTSYQLAKEYNLPVKGSLSNMNPANTVVTRGEMAKILASYHQGKNVSERDAVEWMYNNNLASGYADKSGKLPMTYESFGVKDQLSRAHVVSFLQRYDVFASNGGVSKPTNPPIQQPPVQNEQINFNGMPYVLSNGKVSFENSWADTSLQPKTVGSIKTDFGNTYGVKNQTEYDQAIKIVKESVKGYKDKVSLGEYEQYYEEYFNGARFTGGARNITNDRDQALYNAEKNFGAMIKAGATKEQVYDILKIRSTAINIEKNAKDPLDGTPSSMYDVLIRGLVDCDASGQVDQAVFNMAGYKTKMIGMGTPHAEAAFQLNGKWFTTRGFLPVN